MVTGQVPLPGLGGRVGGIAVTGTGVVGLFVGAVVGLAFVGCATVCYISSVCAVISCEKV